MRVEGTSYRAGAPVHLAARSTNLAPWNSLPMAVPAEGNGGRQRVIGMSGISHSTAEQYGVAFPSQLGWMAARWGNGGLQRLAFGYRSARAALRAIGLKSSRARLLPPLQELVARLQAFADGEPRDLRDVTIDWRGRTPFQRAVLEQCRCIGRGELWTYGDLAARAGYPRSARAVGTVMATNPIPLIIPCHRVVAAGGALGGFSAPDGLHMKLRLIEMEGALPHLKSRATLVANPRNSKRR